jgi:hypothetical protein
MPNEEYLAYLKSPQWRALREQVLARDKYQCFECGARGRLEVHHTTYARIFKEDIDDLITLCRACHEEEHTTKPIVVKVKVLPYKPPPGPTRGSKVPPAEYSKLPRRLEDVKVRKKPCTAAQAIRRNSKG